FDLVLIQEPYLDGYRNTTANSHWAVLYPYSRHKVEGSATVRSVILVNTRLSTNAWSQLPLPDSLDITALTLRCGLGDLTVLNAY
ncbi:hypothetical protein BDV98DRAFT_476123, partial [Pterulicium gracile]